MHVRVGAIGVAAAMLACNGGEDTEDTQLGACGEVTTHDLTVDGRVVEVGGAAVVGAAVELQDRGWAPGTVLGTATTTAGGDFRLSADGVTSVEDCWGVMLDYVIVATEGARSGELPVNQPLYAAITDGTLVADVTGTPVEIE